MWSCTLHVMATRSASSRSAVQGPSSAKSTTKRSQTDWARVDATRDEDIDLSDSPELTPEMLLNAIVVDGPNQARFAVATDRRTATWFLRAPEGRDAAVRAALREYIERHPRNK